MDIDRTGSKANIAQENWIEPTLTNSWINFGVGFANCSYLKDTLGFVHIRGVVRAGTVGFLNPIFTLPLGYRPSENINFSIASNDAYGQLAVKNDGQVALSIGSNVWAALTVTFKAV